MQWIIRSGLLCSSKCMNVIWAVLLSWSSASLILTSGSLRQNVIDAAVNKSRKQLRACVRADGEHFEQLAYCELVVKLKKYEQTKCAVNFVYARLYLFTAISRSYSFPSKACTMNRWGGKLNHHAVAYLLRNNCAKNYWNQTTTFQIIVGGWMVYFLQHCV